MKNWPRLIYIVIYIHRTQLTKPSIKVSHVNKKRQTQRLCPDSSPDFPSAIAWFQGIFLLDSKLALRRCPSENRGSDLTSTWKPPQKTHVDFPPVPTPKNKKQKRRLMGSFWGGLGGLNGWSKLNGDSYTLCFFLCVNEKKHIAYFFLMGWGGGYWWDFCSSRAISQTRFEAIKIHILDLGDYL